MDALAWRLALFVVLAAPLFSLAAPQMPGRAWNAPDGRVDSLRVQHASAIYRWAAPAGKVAIPAEGRLVRVGFERAAPKEFSPLDWKPVAGGFVARFDIVSAQAEGLRVRLELAGAPPLEVRVADAGGKVESMRVRAGEAQAWGPWTPGSTQSVEIFSFALPAEGSVQLGGVVHFDQALDAKAAGTCTMDVLCTTGDAALDGAIAVRKKSMARIVFSENGLSYTCTGTLLDSAQYPTPYFLTANHCIGSVKTASSITSLWFYENSSCGEGPASSAQLQVAGGMDLTFADPNTDQTLLTMRAAPPSGAVFSAWNAAKLAVGDSVVSLSHPVGDVGKWALATVNGFWRMSDWEQSVWATQFSRGIIQGGSSGSGLFTLANGVLTLRSVLSATTVDAQGGLSCSNLDQFGIYNRFDVFVPEAAQFLVASSPDRAPDDHANTPSAAQSVEIGAAGTTVRGRIDYAGDVDVIRIPVSAAGTLIARADGAIDTVGVLLDANGERLTSNDDAQADTLGYGITWTVAPGTYYLVTTRWESAGTGDYSIRLALSPVTSNYTDLWWNPDESGWGINVNHQGEILFATLFTYEANGTPMWLVLARGDRQPDGSFQGALLRTSGPAFNAAPWTPATNVTVGTMRLSFPNADTGYLEYTVNGVRVTKAIQRQQFVAAKNSCSWSAFDRTIASNFQDLWWNAAEDGWGINLAHRGDTLFATLFTYGADRRGLWLVMSNGVRQPGTASFSGTLFSTTGPAFDAAPWTGAKADPVGKMTLSFSDGNSGTLDYTVGGVSVTKKITRQVFATPATQCENVSE